MFNISNNIPYELYQTLTTRNRLNYGVYSDSIELNSEHRTFESLKYFIQSSRGEISRTVEIFYNRNELNRAYIDGTFNPDVSGLHTLLELYNIIYQGLSIKLASYNLDYIIEVLEDMEKLRFNLETQNERFIHCDLPKLKPVLKPDIYKTIYTLYHSGSSSRSKLNEEDFAQEGFIKVNTEQWNLIVTKAMERDGFENPEVHFKELYYNEDKDKYIYYTNTADDYDKNWTLIAAFLYTIVHDELIQTRLDEQAIALLDYCLGIFKYKRITKGEGLQNAINTYLNNSTRLNKLNEIIKNEYIKQQFKNSLLGTKLRLLTDKKARYQMMLNELLDIEEYIKHTEKDLIVVENEVDKLTKDFMKFKDNNELIYYNLTQDGKLIYSINTAMDFVETDLIEMLRTTSSNFRVVNLLRDLYLNDNGYIYGTSTFELDLNTKRIKLHEEQPMPQGIDRGPLSKSGNPHHTGYRCLGNYERHLGTLANDLNFTGLFDMSLAAVKNFNVADSAVIERYNSRLYDIAVDLIPAPVCMVNFNGETMTYKDYLNTTSHVINQSFESYDDEEETDWEEEEETDWDYISNRIDDINYNLTRITHPIGDLDLRILPERLNTIRTNFQDLSDQIGVDLEDVFSRTVYDVENHIILDDDSVFSDFYEQAPPLIQNMANITLDFGNFLTRLQEYVETKMELLVENTLESMTVSEEVLPTLLQIRTVPDPVMLLENLEIDFDSLAFKNIAENLNGQYIHDEAYVDYAGYDVPLNPTTYPMFNNQHDVYGSLMNLAYTYLDPGTIININTFLDDILAAMVERQDAVPTTPITIADLEQAAQEVQADIADRHIMNQRRRMASPVHQGVREFDYDANDENRYTVAEDIHTGVIGTRINGEFMRFESLENFEQYLLENPHVNPQIYPYEYLASNGNTYRIDLITNEDNTTNLLQIQFDGHPRLFTNIEAFEEFLQTFPGLRPDLDAVPVPDPERIMRQAIDAAVDYATIPPGNYTMTWTGNIDTGREATTEDEQTTTREEDFEW